VNSWVAVAVGGAIGASARYGVYLLSSHYLGTQFPHATILVNIIGSFVMGILIELSALNWTISSELRLFLLVGILGAFTTFSTFSLDFAMLYERGRLFLAALYLTLSVIGSIGALFMGLALVRRMVTV